MKALVTGSSGFIGSHVVAKLAETGADVRAFDSVAPARETAGVEHFVGDILDSHALHSALADRDTVFHLAAIYSYSRSDHQAMAQVNVEGTRRLLDEAVRGRKRRIVLTSSVATCGPVPGRLATESDTPPSWELKVPYKRTKLEAEKLGLRAATEGHDLVIVNPTTPVGPGDRRPTPTGQMIADVVSGRIRGYVSGTALNIVAIEDVATAHLLAFEKGVSGEKYLLGGENLPLADVFATIAKHAGRKPPRIRVPYWPLFGAAWLVEQATRLNGGNKSLLSLDEVRLARWPMVFDCSKARKSLSFQPRDAASALKSAADWFKDRPS